MLDTAPAEILLPSLRHITLDTHCAMAPTTIAALWTSLFAKFKSWASPLASLTLKMSERLVLGDEFVEDLLGTHGKSLEVIKFINCTVSLDCLVFVCKRAVKLRILGITIPPKDDFVSSRFCIMDIYLPNLLALLFNCIVQIIHPPDVD